MAVLLYEGPSRVSPTNTIGVFATLDSDNTKTGRSVQIWILVRAEAPQVAQKTGRDEAICGNCVQRPINGGNCYVQTDRAPNAIWRAWRDGRLQTATVAQIRAIARQHGLMRLGAYGDPTMIPLPLLRELCADNMPITGYTHQWRNEFAHPYKQYLMASCETLEDAKKAQSWGWRTFRVTNSLNDRVNGEVRCPASKEAGNKLQCRNCRACDGLHRNLQSNIVIMEH